MTSELVLAFATLQSLNPILILILASTAVSTLLLAALILLFFRWLERGTQGRFGRQRVSVCMYCGSRSLSVSLMKDAAGRETAFCHCNNCKRYFSLEIPPQ